MVGFNMKISQHEVSQKMDGFVPSWPRSVISALASFTTHFIQRLCLLMFIILFPQQHSPAQPTCTSSSLYSMTQWIHSLFPVLLDLTHLPEGPSIHITSVVLWPLFLLSQDSFPKANWPLHLLWYLLTWLTQNELNESRDIPVHLMPSTSWAFNKFLSNLLSLNTPALLIHWEQEPFLFIEVNSNFGRKLNFYFVRSLLNIGFQIFKSL